VLSSEGREIHPDIVDEATGSPLKFIPENKALRNSVINIEYDPDQPDLFRHYRVETAPIPSDRKAFEPAWKDYREGKIYNE
jgi:hypothetical protein